MGKRGCRCCLLYTSDIKDYPAYAVKLDDKIVGFCYLCSYKNYKTLRETAEVICYLSYDAKGKGIGYNLSLIHILFIL